MQSDNVVLLSGALLLSFKIACVNLNFYIDDEMQAFLDHVRPDEWYPLKQMNDLIALVSARYEEPGPIIEQIGVEMMRAWYNHGPGREVVQSGVDFLTFQTSSHGYGSVFRGPKELLGKFQLESLDTASGRAVVFSTTPFQNDLERGVLRGGMSLAGDLTFVEIESSRDGLRFYIRFTKGILDTELDPDAPLRAIDAQEFFLAEELPLATSLAGAELHQVFWQYRAMAREVERMRLFWESTNATMSHSLAMLSEKREALRRSYDDLMTERQKSERLLLNILPKSVASQLKEKPGIIANECPEATILFIDTVNFTRLSGRISATQLITVLNKMFSLFDEVADKYGVEKIKTIGDAYMAAANLTESRPDHASAMAEVALEISERMDELPTINGEQIEVRMGFHVGLVVSGVIGASKFIFDVWGDTVNFASRMESCGLPGRVQVSEEVYERLHDRYEFEPRTVTIKHKGEMLVYLLNGRKDEPVQKKAAASG